MMRSFDVLDASHSLGRHALLEASAGTGKTFAIEHLVARSVLAGVPLEKILIVTFTRAATKELKERIQLRLSSLSSGQECPEYLKVIEDQPQAMRRLKRALASIDQASILTIHGFCLKALQQQEGIPEDRIVEPLSRHYLEGVVRDYWRTKLDESPLDNAQVAKLLGAFGQHLDRLQSKLAQAIASSESIDSPPRFSGLSQEIEELLGEVSFESLAQELVHLSPQYKGLMNRQKQLKDEVISLIDQLRGGAEIGWWYREGRELLQRFQEVNRLKKSEAIPPKKPLQWEKIQEQLLPLLQQAMDEEAIFRVVAAECQKLLQAVLQKEQRLHPDKLLEEVKAKLDSSEFLRSIQQEYQMAVIDEFQDTDALQWEIFRRLFLNENHLLYLVGDPKQSIYGFRNADIYTYLQAAHGIGEQNIYSLDTNYRSAPEIVSGLNHLFSHAKGWLSLPNCSGSIQFEPVKSGSETVGEGVIRFPIGQSEEQIMHWIAQKTTQLWREFECVILVRDRFQSERMKRVLELWGLPVVMRQCQGIWEIPDYEAIRDTLRATLNPRSLNKVKIALSSTLFGFDSTAIQQLDEIEPLEEALGRFYRLRNLLAEKGLSAWCEAVFVEGDRSADLEQLLDLILQHQARSQCGAEGVLAYLEEMPSYDLEEHPELFRRSLGDQKGVQIMTLHASKGLEFDVVFTLGLTTTSKRRFDCSNRSIDEEKSESLRLLYVAMTRAKTHLYCPILQGKPTKGGEYSPMDLFLEHFDGGIEALGFEVESIGSIDLVEPIKAIPEPVEAPILKRIDIPQPRYTIESYTSLHQNIGAKVAIEPPEHHPPKGRKTGIILHSLMEELGREGFTQCNPDWVEERLASTPLAPFAEVCHSWIEQVIHQDFKGFRLVDVEPNQVLVENEFLYATDSGFVKGVIDLVLFWQDRVYLFDWKSNCLPDYSSEALEAVMKGQGYDLQARLYAESIDRWISDRGLTFGGSYFVFLRGGKSLFVPPVSLELV